MSDSRARGNSSSAAPTHAADSPAAVRIDKWLWAARFYGARSLARDAVERGRVLVGGERVKASRTMREGDVLALQIGDAQRTVRVMAISDRRGPASVAQLLYEETAESITRRVESREARRVYVEPANAIEGGRPTKRDRRKLADWERGS